MVNGASSLENLAKSFASMPGVSMKFAWKLAFYVLTLKRDEVLSISNNIIEAFDKTKRCSVCQNFTDKEVCNICSNKNRDKSKICVVQYPKDVFNLERCNAYFGRYHVLHGLLSPAEGIGPNKITIKELVQNIKQSDCIKEVILATNPTVEGEATAMYIANILKSFNLSLTRIAYGISVGSEIQHADSMTVLKAIENRNKI